MTTIQSDYDFLCMPSVW